MDLDGGHLVLIGFGVLVFVSWVGLRVYLDVAGAEIRPATRLSAWHEVEAYGNARLGWEAIVDVTLADGSVRRAWLHTGLWKPPKECRVALRTARSDARYLEATLVHPLEFVGVPLLAVIGLVMFGLAWSYA